MNTDRIFSQSEAEEFKTVLKNLIDKNVPSYLQSRVNNFLEHFSEAYEYRLYFRKIRNIDLDSSYFRNNVNIEFDSNVCVIYSIYDGLLCQRYLIAVFNKND